MLNIFRDENNMYISSVQIELHFISTSYETRSTVTRHYPLLCSYARSNSQIPELLVDIAGFRSYRLETSIGVGRRIISIDCFNICNGLRDFG